MEIVFLTLFGALVGALIGSATNYMAIQMLFRPRHPYFIGKWQVPLTPGLIPKRHMELAQKLGKLVETQLFPVEMLQQKWGSESVQSSIEDWIRTRLKAELQSERTVADIVKMVAPIHVQSQKQWVEDKLRRLLGSILPRLWQRVRNESAQSLVDISDNQRQHWARQIRTYSVQQLHAFVASNNGKDALSHLLNRFIDGQPFLRTIRSMIPRERGVDRLQHTIVEALHDEQMTEMMDHQISRWMKQALERPLRDWVDESMMGNLQQKVENRLIHDLEVEKWLQQPLRTWGAEWENVILDQLPRILASVREWGDRQTVRLYETIGVSQLVTEQVHHFSLLRLEKLIRDFARKEFTLITVLGGVLGAFIGALQAVLMTFWVAA